MKYRRKHGIIFVTILIGMLLTAGCGKAKESNVTVGNKVPQLDTSTETSKKKTKGSDKKQESEEKTEEKKDVYIVYRIDDETQTIRLQKVKNGKFSEYGMRLHTETNTESLPVKEILQKAVRSRSEQPIRKANFPIYSSQIRCGSRITSGNSR